MLKTYPAPIGKHLSGCHTASVWDLKSQENIPRLMKFMNNFGLITARHPEKKYNFFEDNPQYSERGEMRAFLKGHQLIRENFYLSNNENINQILNY